MTLAMSSTTDFGYDITRSLRLRASASAYLNRTLTTPTSQNTWTMSVWVKRGLLGAGANSCNIGPSPTGGNYQIFFNTADLFNFYNGTGYVFQTTQVFRDPSSWYHIVLAVSSGASGTNKVRLYVNGSEVTSFSTDNRSAFTSSPINTAVVHNIGRYTDGAVNYYDGQVAEYYFIDGQQLTPSSFGYKDSLTGVWQPSPYVGTYGNNGFYLKFTDNSAATATTIGKDYSGNGNNWTPNNISVTTGSTYDSMTDVPTITNPTTANYCTLNPLSGYTISGAITYSNGNLNYSTSLGAVDTRFIRGTLAVSSGKWYWEITPTDVSTDATGTIIGIMNATQVASNSGGSATNISSSGYGYIKSGNKLTGSTSTAYGASYVANDVIGVALDMDAGTLTFYKNGVSQGTAFTGLTGSYLPLIAYSNSAGSTTYAGYTNFGQRAFAYTAPSGYNALCTYPVAGMTIPNGAKYTEASLYTGTGANLTIVNPGTFQPDLVWLKSRSAGTDNKLTDSNRGATIAIVSNSSNAQTTDATGLIAFTSTGFTLGNSTTYNNATSTYVAWQWQAGQGVSANNTSGTITSTVSVNPYAGFSVTKFTGTGVAATVGHGLGIAPSFIIMKNTATTNGWPVYHASLGNTQKLVLNLTDATGVDGTAWNNTSPTSAVFSVGTSAATNGNTNLLIAYCWSQIAGFSAFGSYVGNANADGPFVYTNFRPKFILIKNASDATANWRIYDSSRSPYNVAAVNLYPNSAGAENAGTFLDIVSNGFKIRTTGTGENGSGNTIVYAAFAENPFKYALAR